jgi:hypothetical protein
MPFRVLSRLLALLALLGFFLWISKRTFFASPMIFGDGIEYVLQTQAIVFDHTLAIDPVARGAYFNETNPYGRTVLFEPSQLAGREFRLDERNQFGGGFGSLYLALDGTYRFAHAWIYSAAVAPFYALLHVIQPGAFEYRAFALANLCFLLVALFLLWRLQPGWASVAFLVTLFASPLTPFLQWAHSEIFCASGVIAAFGLLRYSRWRWLSPVLVGVVAAQNIPLVLLFPFHFYLYAQESGWRLTKPRRVTLRDLRPYMIAVALPVIVMCQSQLLFGEWNIIPALGFADFSNLTLHRIAAVAVSPIGGVLWYFPLALVACALVVVAGRWREALLCGVSILAVAALSLTTNNFNSAQLSASRYSMWFVAVLWTLPFYVDAFQVCATKRIVSVVVLFSSILCASVLWWLKTYTFLFSEWSSFVALKRAVPEVAALYRWTHFNDDVEVLVENIKQAELVRPHELSDIYIWNLGANQSMWVVSKRAFLKLDQMSVRLRGASPPALVNELSAFSVEQVQPKEVALRPRPEVAFSKNPYLGGYLILWVSSEIESVEAPVRVFVRDSAVE